MANMKRDLNFFTAYSKGQGKSGAGGLMGLLVIVLSFILIVAGVYGVLFFFERNLEIKVDDINEELSLPQTMEVQERLNALSRKSSLMTSYFQALKTAKENFDSSREIDSELFKILTSSMPSTVTLTSISISPQSIVMNCTATNRLSSVVFSNALKEKNIFSKVIYNGYIMDEAEDELNTTFTFTINCFY